MNDLTYVILRATELMRLRDPNLNAQVLLGSQIPRNICGGCVSQP